MESQWYMLLRISLIIVQLSEATLCPHNRGKVMKHIFRIFIWFSSWFRIYQCHQRMSHLSICQFSIACLCQIMDCALIKHIDRSFHWHLCTAGHHLQSNGSAPELVSCFHESRFGFRKSNLNKHAYFWDLFRFLSNQTGPNQRLGCSTDIRKKMWFFQCQAISLKIMGVCL